MDIRSVGNAASTSQVLTDAAAQTPSPKTAAPVELPDAVQQAASVPSTEQLNDALKRINKAMEAQSRGVE